MILCRAWKSVANFVRSSEKDKVQTMYPHEWAPFVEVHKEVENSIKAGFDANTKTWKPHGSLEGGTPTLAYGHKLLQRDIDNGDVYINGIPHPVWNLPDDMAVPLLVQDLRQAEFIANSQWNAFHPDGPLYGRLELKYQAVLAAVVFNAGSFIQNGKLVWPKLWKAIKERDDSTVFEEMLTSYKKPDGTRVYLKERRDAIAKAIGLVGPSETPKRQRNTNRVDSEGS